jgi:hypothetical protein
MRCLVVVWLHHHSCAACGVDPPSACLSRRQLCTSFRRSPPLGDSLLQSSAGPGGVASGAGTASRSGTSALVAIGSKPFIARFDMGQVSQLMLAVAHAPSHHMSPGGTDRGGCSRCTLSWALPCRSTSCRILWLALHAKLLPDCGQWPEVCGPRFQPTLTQRKREQVCDSRCCVVLCCVVLCCVVLCCVVLCCVVLCCVLLRCVVLCCVLLRCVGWDYS